MWVIDVSAIGKEVTTVWFHTGGGRVYPQVSSRVVLPGTMAPMQNAPSLPRKIAGIEVPQDDVSAVTWRWAPAIAREAAIRPTCQSARLLNRTGLAAAMARSPWATEPGT
jgi:hypothetical protein